MSITYRLFSFNVNPVKIGSEILIAELAELGFDSFEETAEGVDAYLLNDKWNKKILSGLNILSNLAFDIKYSSKIIHQKNWNKIWESNFKPILINKYCGVRANFHPPLNLKYELVITPKMSFGTGHHETTHMMIQHLLVLDLENKRVLDMGCGTGILAIFAEMKGAKPLDAIDIDSWCYKNSIENIERNNCHHISVYEGDASLLKEKKYDVIIANINRNSLLSDMNTYTDCLDRNGILLLSGFYKEDITIIDNEVTKYGLTFEKKIQRNNWVALKYLKL